MTMIFNFEKKIDHLISQKPKEVIAQVNARVPECFQFDILKRQYIEKLWESKGISDEVYAIFISKEVLGGIDFSSVVGSKDFIDSTIKQLENCNIIELNKKLEVIHSTKYNNGIIKYCCDLSKSDKCVFLLKRNGIKIIIDGEIVLENSLFINEEDYLEYSQKLDITQISEVFAKYQEYLNSDNSKLFFENESTVKTIENSLNSKNILVYKPEKIMKDHLRDFLNKNVRRTFNMNYILSNSGREIDIYAEDKDFYFITVKWLGVSINENKSKLNAPNTDYDARAGVTQNLEYIRELREHEGFSERTMKKGYLVVYDARDEKNTIQYNIKNIDVDLEKYKDHFEIVSEFTIENKFSA